ncbi:hypothetical protein [Haloferula sp. A504]|uniref:hypothetical protein n=1 Tax=Haloferula sp. A504 TaxID=3373601 RepID=UPI0031C44D98|nr:hypothetical protein [Verrucomicrobiaceae bacterium E54]
MPMISRRKERYQGSPALVQYLFRFDRLRDIPSVYEDLTRFAGSMPYENPKGEETLWLTVYYDPEHMRELRPKLTKIYSELKAGGMGDHHDHLSVDRIDFGEFGNSRPFRVRITNDYNDNSDYFYVKHVDASRIYGLELEHILSPNRINYLIQGNTLIEEHIAGVPGDVFLRDYLPDPELNRVRIAKEFTKFNERCFIRLLGDMRSVNYVVDITPDFEEVQYRVRPIDFDQQSYEGRGKTYLAYRFDSNRPVTRLAFKSLDRKSIDQYVAEEHAQMAQRAKVEAARLKALLGVLRRDEIAPDKHVRQLARDLAKYHHTDIFRDCETMGELTATHILHMLEM